MRFHVLGLSHTKTTRQYSACAFTQKVRLLCKMLKDRGHEVIHYGTEGSDPECTEHVSVVSKETWDRVHGNFDWHKSMFELGRDNDAYREFEKNCGKEIAARAHPREFLLCTFGWNHKPIADKFPQLMAVESGIGYPATWSKYRAFESYAWLHFHWGKEDRGCRTNFYDVVIPNYFDLADYTYRPDKEDYFMWIGRPTILKGLNIASDVCKRLGVRLVAAGQGEPPPGIECEHLGVISIEERDKWLGGAKGLFVPTYYLEPFGTVSIEAALCGTPVITTNFGCFTENVIHGVTGFRCNTFEQFMWAAKNIDQIKPEDCRRWGASNFSLERVALMYEEYFHMLEDLWTPEGWYSMRRERDNLDWLRRTY